MGEKKRIMCGWNMFVFIQCSKFEPLVSKRLKNQVELKNDGWLYSHEASLEEVKMQNSAIMLW